MEQMLSHFMFIPFYLIPAFFCIFFFKEMFNFFSRRSNDNMSVICYSSIVELLGQKSLLQISICISSHSVVKANAKMCKNRLNNGTQ